MFRLPPSKNITMNQSPGKKVVGIMQKGQGLCKFPHRKCNLLSLENYDFCLKHILEDKSAPYKPCPFLYTVSGKKCGKPAYRSERKDTWFCPEHTRKAQVVRQKATARHAPPETQEALLASLGHYARANSVSGVTKKEENDNDESSNKDSSQAVNPFVEVNANQVNARCSQVLDYASDSDSDVDVAMLDSVWRAQDHESSDAESVDSQAEDPLKHAGVYTAEEVMIIIKDKMIRLQSLYIDQFRRLHHLLKERRRKYLHALKKEKEALCSIHDQEKTSAKEQKLYQKLKALNHFHKYYGEEAVLHKKALERRAQITEGCLVRTSHKGKCAFTEGGVKCGAKTLPVTKYCRKHILEDNQQVLFRACGYKRADHTCQEPTVNIFENATCVLHITVPAQPHNNLEMKEAKEEINPEKTTQETNQAAESMDVDTLELTVEEKNPLDQKMPLLDQPDPENSILKPAELVDSVLKSEVLPSLEPPVCNEPPPIEKGETEKMDCDKEEPNTKLDIHNTEHNTEVSSSKEEPEKNENPAGELLMVDMMTDVGVVEEVLESEEKPQVQEGV